MDAALAPTLSNLRAELDQLDAEREKINSAMGAKPDDNTLYKAYELALEACWRVLDQVASIPAATMGDLKVKAYVLNWSANLVDGESYTNPSDGEEQIMRALVAGLLDERIV